MSSACCGSRLAALDPPPLPWDGDDVAVAAGGGRVLLFTGEQARPGVLWDYRTGRWSTLPRAPLPRFGATATWTGSALIVWGGGSFAPAGPRASGVAWAQRS